VSDSLLHEVGDEISALLAPITRAVASPDARTRLFADLGVVAGDDDDQLITSLRAVGDLVTAVQALAAEGTRSFASVTAVLEASERAFTLARDVEQSSSPVPGAEGLGRDLIELLAAAWLGGRHPIAREVAALLTLLDAAEDASPKPLVEVNGEVVRLPVAIDRFHLDRIVGLLRDPVTTLRGAYVNNLETDEDAHAVADRLFRPLLRLLRDLGVPCRYGFVQADEPLLGEAAPLISHALIVYVDDELNGAPAEAGVMVAISPAERADLGLVVTPFGSIAATRSAGSWAVDLQLTAGVDALAYGRHGLTVLASAGTVDVAGRAAATLVTFGEDPASVLGAPDGTRLEIGGARLCMDATLSEARQALAFSADLSPAALVIAPADADAFVASLLPAEGLRTDFDLEVAWSSESGFAFRGHAGLEATIPVGLSLAGLTLSSVHLALLGRDGLLVAEVSASLGASIGPVRALVDRFGIEAVATFPEEGGNVGVANLKMRIKPPSGIGLVIDAGPITGGGFLGLDEAAGEYAGVLVLSFRGLTIKALGLLNTKAPEPTGWSLLLLLYAEFRETPWQLGLGFNITAVGGIFGLQHIASVEQLRASLGTIAFDDVLFPADPVKDAPRILGRLRTLFPIQAGALTVGPVVEVNWATPPIVVARLAILAQFTGVFGGGNFGFTRLTVLGTVRATAPSATIDAPRLADLTADVLGDYDVESGLLAIDARLRDSKLGGVEFSGSLIVRIGMGRTPAFAIAAGGFHPGFVDLPPAMPGRIDRLGLIWKLGDSIVLTLQAYAAVTASSWQLGALFTLRADIGPVNIDGALGFDAIAYDDGRFSVTIGGHVKIRWRGHALMAVSITVTLDRNAVQVWHAAGTAKFSVLWWDKEVDFEHTWGTERSLPPATPVDAPSLVRAGLAEPGNWASQLPTGGESLVALTDPQRAPGSVPVRVLAHPLGTLSVTQRVAPVGLRLDYVDGAPVASGTIVEIGPVRVGPVAAVAATRPTTQLFARARFQELSESERLTQKTFEAFPAGVAITPEGQANPVGAVTDFDFERIFLAPDSVKKPPPAKSFPGQPSWHLRTGPASRSPLRGAGRLVRGLHVRDVAVGPPLVVLVGDRDLAEAAQLSDEEARSATLARQRLRAGQLVVEAHEVGV
jgi:Family of unknown function (DUF6603)